MLNALIAEKHVWGTGVNVSVCVKFYFDNNPKEATGTLAVPSPACAVVNFNEYNGVGSDVLSDCQQFSWLAKSK